MEELTGAKLDPATPLIPTEDLNQIEVGPLPKGAGGGAAVWSALQHGIRHMGAARAAKALLKVNQKGGFDCPGCAWPDPDDRRAMVEFCENGAKAVAEEGMRQTIGAEFFAQHAVTELLRQSDFWLGQQGRLAEPLVRQPGKDHYEQLSWENAFSLIAAELNALPAADAATFYTSGRTSNEAAFLYQLFVRQFGTNNLPDCSNLCHESSGHALIETIGVGKGTVTLEDFAAADLIIVVGQNPGTNHPRMLTTLQEAKRGGCRILSINPLKEVGLERFGHPQELRGWLTDGTALADHHLPVRINGDVALFQALSKALLIKNSGTIARRFIEEKTAGFGAWEAAMAALQMEKLLQQAGLSQEEFAQAVTMIDRSERVIVTWAMGLTQHKNAVGNIREIVNFLLLTGNIGKKGAGPCPIRGHSNVQGDRTMGICERPTEVFLDQLQNTFGFAPPRQHGTDVVGAIKGMHAGTIKVFMGLGGNFLTASPDSEFTAAALQRCLLTVHVSTKLNRSHLTPGKLSLILPALARSDIDLQNGVEQFVTVENSMGIVHSSRGNLRPRSSQMRSEVSIVAGIAAVVLGDKGASARRGRDLPKVKMDWLSLAQNYSLIRNLIAETLPAFSDFGRRIQDPKGFYLPNSVRDSCTFNTKSGKAHFTLNSLSEVALGAGESLMMTIRSHDQYNTTIYGLDDRYRGVRGGRRVIFMNALDIQEQGLADGEWVDLVSRYGGQERWGRGFRVVAYGIPRQCVATYFPESNVLVPIDEYADGSRTPISKSVVIKVVAKEPRSHV